MRFEPVEGIQPKVLKWARESANLTLVDVATKLKKSADIIEEWEKGGSAPTYPQLEKLAYELYKRPLALFFLPAPPPEPKPQTEFRSLPADDLITLDRDTIFLIRKARAFHVALHELFGDRSPVEAPIWKEIRLSAARPVAQQATAVRNALSVNLDQQSSWRDADHALREWRRSIETRGVFVFKHAFKQREISGFCLVKDELPLIMINNSTTKTRQIFSLLHELAHVLFHRSGISRFDDTRIEALPNVDRNIERFCNEIAAEILVPAEDFRICATRRGIDPGNATDDDFSDFARRYHVSREVILRRFLDEGSITRPFYLKKSAEWVAQIGDKGGSGGNYYATQGAYLSEAFLRAVLGRYARRQLTKFEAADLIGIAPKNLSKLQDQVLQGASG